MPTLLLSLVAPEKVSPAENNTSLCFTSGGLDFKGNAMICGGFALENGNFYQDCYVNSGSEWTSSPSFQTSKEFSTMVTPQLCDHSAMGIISTGGNQRIKGEAVLSTVEVLREGTGVWRSDLLPPMPDPLWTHCTVYINTTTFMVIGGSKPGLDASDKTYYYFSETRTWTEGPTLLRGRNSHSCGRIKSSKESSGKEKNSLPWWAGSGAK